MKYELSGPDEHINRVELPSVMDWADIDPDRPTPAGWDFIEPRLASEL